MGRGRRNEGRIVYVLIFLEDRLLAMAFLEAQIPMGLLKQEQ